MSCNYSREVPETGLKNFAAGTPVSHVNQAQEKQPELAGKLDCLSKAIDNLDQTIDDVILRLRPLSGQAPEKDANLPTSPSSTQIGGLIQSDIDKVCLLHQRLLSLLNVLEV